MACLLSLINDTKLCYFELKKIITLFRVVCNLLFWRIQGTSNLAFLETQGQVLSHRAKLSQNFTCKAHPAESGQTKLKWSCTCSVYFQTFIVRKSSQPNTMALSIQFPDKTGQPNVDHYLIERKGNRHHLQGSVRLFDDVPSLIMFYCENR